MHDTVEKWMDEVSVSSLYVDGEFLSTSSPLPLASLPRAAPSSCLLVPQQVTSHNMEFHFITFKTHALHKPRSSALPVPKYLARGDVEILMMNI